MQSARVEAGMPQSSKRADGAQIRPGLRWNPAELGARDTSTGNVVVRRSGLTRLCRHAHTWRHKLHKASARDGNPYVAEGSPPRPSIRERCYRAACRTPTQASWQLHHTLRLTAPYCQVTVEVLRERLSRQEQAAAGCCFDTAF